MDNKDTSTNRNKSPNKNTLTTITSNDDNEKQRSSSISPNRKHKNKSPPKFGGKDFEKKKVNQDLINKRQSAIAKIKGLKIDSSTWTRIELLTKLKVFAKYNEDIKTNTCSLIIDNYRLLPDDVIVILEILKRSTEIQIIQLNNCSIDDKIYLELSIGLKGLRHLKELTITNNLLTTISINEIVNNFSKLTRKLNILDLHNNSTSFNDGLHLYAGNIDIIEYICLYIFSDTNNIYYYYQ